MAHKGEVEPTAKDDPGSTQRPIAFLPTAAFDGGSAGEMACPLHVALQELAQAAVSQSVYYAEGEYTPRPHLMRELERWQQAHRLIADGVCPGSRAAGIPTVALGGVRSLIPEDRFATVHETHRRCSQRNKSDPCPLAGESDARLVTSQ